MTKLWNTGTIVLNFVEDGNHGCDKHCSFCAWNKNNYNILVKPSDNEVLLFLSKITPGARICFCGGGDPLYHFEKNKDYLRHLIDLIHKNGFKIQIITKYVETVAKYFDAYLYDIEMFSFSTEILDNNLLTVIKKLTSIGKYVRVSKVANLTPKLSEINWAFIEDYIKYYSSIKHKDKLSICLRPNFNFEYRNDELFSIRNKVLNYSNIFGCHVYMHNQGKYITTMQLWNGRYIECKDADKYIILDLAAKEEANDN